MGWDRWEREVDDVSWKVELGAVRSEVDGGGGGVDDIRSAVEGADGGADLARGDVDLVGDSVDLAGGDGACAGVGVDLAARALDHDTAPSYGPLSLHLLFRLVFVLRVHVHVLAYAYAHVHGYDHDRSCPNSDPVVGGVIPCH